MKPFARAATLAAAIALFAASSQPLAAEKQTPCETQCAIMANFCLNAGGEMSYCWWVWLNCLSQCEAIP